MSGLSRTPGKRVWVNSPPRVRIPPSPPNRDPSDASHLGFFLGRHGNSVRSVAALAPCGWGAGTALFVSSTSACTPADPPRALIALFRQALRNSSPRKRSSSRGAGLHVKVGKHCNACLAVRKVGGRDAEDVETLDESLLGAGNGRWCHAVAGQRSGQVGETCGQRQTQPGRRQQARTG
jgi:hypothetical protein